MVNFGRGIDASHPRRQAEARRRVSATGCSTATRRAAKVNVFGPLGRRDVPIPRRARTCCASPAARASPACCRSSSTAIARAVFRAARGPRFLRRAHAARWILPPRSCPTSRPRAHGKLEVTIALSHEQPPGALAPAMPMLRLSTAWSREWRRRAWPAATTTCRLRGRPAADGGRRPAHAGQGSARAAAIHPLRQVQLSAATAAQYRRTPIHT